MVHAARMLIATGVVMSFGAGCGDEGIDPGKVEDYIREQARLPQVIEEVTCPDGLDAREGDTCDCAIVREGGGEEAATIRQLDADGSIQIVGHRQTKPPPDASNVRIIPENVEAYIRGNA